MTIFFFLASCAILFFVIRYRVYIHVTYTNPNSRRVSSRRLSAARGGVPPASPRSFPAPSGEGREDSEIASALAGLGVPKKRAVEIARAASGATFDDRLRAAIQMATKKVA